MEPRAGVNVAPQVRGPVSGSQMLAVVPEQWPLHPENTYPVSGMACRPSVMLAGMLTWHRAPAVPQLMPAPATVPPAGRETVKVNGGPVGSEPVVVEVVPPEVVDPDDGGGADGENVAPHVLTPFNVSHVLAVVPAQSPLHCENAKPESAVAWRPRVMLEGIVTWQTLPAEPQLMPAPVIVPPDGRDTLSRNVAASTTSVVNVVAVR